MPAKAIRSGHWLGDLSFMIGEGSPDEECYGPAERTEKKHDERIDDKSHPDGKIDIGAILNPLPNHDWNRAAASAMESRGSVPRHEKASDSKHNRSDKPPGKKLHRSPSAGLAAVNGNRENQEREADVRDHSVILPNAQDDPGPLAGATGAAAAGVRAEAIGSGAWFGHRFLL